MDASAIFNVNGLVAVITGGGSGLGLMMAKALEANGATVYIIGRQKASLDEAAKLAKHNNIHPIPGDVLSKPSLSAAAEAITAQSGYINLLICSAGVAGGPTSHILNVPSASKGHTLSDASQFFRSHQNAEYTDHYEINVVGTLNTVFAFAPLLGKGNEKQNVPYTSQIIGIGSVSGLNLNPYVGYGYSTAKMAQMFALKQLGVYLERWGVRVNVLCPGLYPSKIHELVKSQHEAFGAGVPREVSPLGRVGKEEEMQGAILFLASRAGAYCAGTTLLMDGGRLVVNPSAMI